MKRCRLKGHAVVSTVQNNFVRSRNYRIALQRVSTGSRAKKGGAILETGSKVVDSSYQA